MLEDAKNEEANKGRSPKKDGRGRKNDTEQTAFIGTTVQEKNVTYPTDPKLLNKVIEYCHKIAQEESIKVRQSYSHEINELKKQNASEVRLTARRRLPKRIVGCAQLQGGWSENYCVSCHRTANTWN